MILFTKRELSFICNLVKQRLRQVPYSSTDCNEVYKSIADKIDEEFSKITKCVTVIDDTPLEDTGVKIADRPFAEAIKRLHETVWNDELFNEICEGFYTHGKYTPRQKEWFKALRERGGKSDSAYDTTQQLSELIDGQMIDVGSAHSPNLLFEGFLLLTQEGRYVKRTNKEPVSVGDDETDMLRRDLISAIDSLMTTIMLMDSANPSTRECAYSIFGAHFDAFYQREKLLPKYRNIAAGCYRLSEIQRRIISGDSISKELIKETWINLDDFKTAITNDLEIKNGGEVDEC